MLRSDWSSLACLPLDLQIFLVILEGFLELAERIECVSDVAVRPALAVLVACVTKRFRGFSTDK